MKTKPKTLTVLVVEDNPAYTMLVRETLGHYEAKDTVLKKEFAENGKQALELFRKLRPDVTFLDINLPDSTGIELLKAFLEMKPDAFITMLTSENQAATVKVANALGAQGYILKPFNAGKLKDAINRYRKHLARVEAIDDFNESHTASNIIRKIKEAEQGGQPPSEDEMLRSWRVLVADGDLGRQTEIQKALSDIGCHPKVVSTGEHAWDVMKNEHFDVLLIDTNLPQIDGYQVANQQRLADKNKPIKTHMIALYSEPEQVNERRLGFAGINSFLIGKIRQQELKDALSTHARTCLRNLEQLFQK